MKIFTLLELLIAILILLLITSITIPFMKDVRNSATSNECRNRLRNIYLANQLYSSDNNTYAISSTKSKRWNEKLIESTYLGVDFLKEDKQNLTCPNGIKLTQYYETNYSMNFMLTLENKNNTPVNISNGINRNTFMLIDGYNNDSILLPDSIKGKSGHEKVLNVNKSRRIARHDNKANIVYLNGQLKSIKSTKLLKIGNNFKQNLQFWKP